MPITSLTPSTSIFILIFFLISLSLISIFLPRYISFTPSKSIKKRKFDAILIKCPINNGFLLSGFIPGKSDIYASVSYDILFKAFLVNMVYLKVTCFVSSEEISIASQRHIKLYSIMKELPNSDFIYWSDIDVIHNRLDFLDRAQSKHRNNCSIVASIENPKFVDRNFRRTYPKGKKYMSGNVLVFRNPEALSFIDIWYAKTLSNMEKLSPSEAVLDDQWAFEYLTQIYKTWVCADNFMGYEGDSEVTHLVGPKKTQKLKNFSTTNRILELNVVVERFKSQIESKKCTQYFMSKISGVHFIAKVAPEQWKTFNFNFYDDDDVKKIFDLCVGVQPFSRTIQMIDFARYIVVYKAGGWYFDADTFPTPETTKLFELSANKSAVVGIEEIYNSKVSIVICQWAFYFSKSNSFLKKLMSDILFDYFYYNKVYLPTSWMTGPIRFGSILKHDVKPLILPSASLTNKYITHHFNASWLSNKKEAWDKLNL